MAKMRLNMGNIEKIFSNMGEHSPIMGDYLPAMGEGSVISPSMGEFPKIVLDMGRKIATEGRKSNRLGNIAAKPWRFLVGCATNCT